MLCTYIMLIVFFTYACVLRLQGVVVLPTNTTAHRQGRLNTFLRQVTITLIVSLSNYFMLCDFFVQREIPLPYLHVDKQLIISSEY